MPNLRDMFQFFLINEFINDAQGERNPSISSKEQKIPIICQTNVPYSSFSSTYSVTRVMLPTIPVDTGPFAGRAFYVFSEPLMLFSPTIFNAREFRPEYLCSHLEHIDIILRLKEFALLSPTPDFTIASTIEPWMHKEREHHYTQLYSG